METFRGILQLVYSYIRYSGIWIGIVFNPFHWQFGLKSNYDVLNNNIFDNSLHLGPVWIRVIIDDGKW
jgi:hypothetical protein